MQPKVGGKLHLRLNTDTSPIADKYREGKLKRTLKREFKSTWNCLEVNGWIRKVDPGNSTCRFQTADVAIGICKDPSGVRLSSASALSSGRVPRPVLGRSQASREGDFLLGGSVIARPGRLFRDRGFAASHLPSALCLRSTGEALLAVLSDRVDGSAEKHEALRVSGESVGPPPDPSWNTDQGV